MPDSTDNRQAKTEALFLAAGYDSVETIGIHQAFCKACDDVVDLGYHRPERLLLALQCRSQRPPRPPAAAHRPRRREHCVPRRIMEHDRMKHWKGQNYWHGDVALGCIRAVVGTDGLFLPHDGAQRLNITTCHRRLRQSTAGHSNRTWRRQRKRAGWSRRWPSERATWTVQCSAQSWAMSAYFAARRMASASTKHCSSTIRPTTSEYLVR